MNIIFQLIIAFLISSLLVYLCIPVIVRISEDKNLMDNPNKRKINKKPIPNLGGVAIFIGISIAMLISMAKMEFIDMRYILATMILIFFIGIKDDILVISPKMKFSVQILCAMILIILGDIRLTNLHGILGINQISYISSFVLSMLTIVGLINAFNLIDGIDGLASGLGILMSLLLGLFFYLWGQIGYAILCAAIVGSLFTFSIFNLFGSVNKIFMGDTGSLIIGLLIAIMAVKFNEFSNSNHFYACSPVISIAIVFIPLADMTRVFLVRIKNKKSPFSPDMTHIHHKYLNYGYSHLHASVAILFWNLAIFAIIFIFRFLNIHLLLCILIVWGAVLPYIPKACAYVYQHILSNKSSHNKSC